MLLNGRVGDYSQMFIKLEANNFFSIIAQVLSYSVILFVVGSILLHLF